MVQVQLVSALSRHQATLSRSFRPLQSLETLKSRPLVMTPSKHRYDTIAPRKRSRGSCIVCVLSNTVQHGFSRQSS